MWDSGSSLVTDPCPRFFSASAYKCSTWNPSATCVCNVCVRTWTCATVYPPPPPSPLRSPWPSPRDSPVSVSLSPPPPYPTSWVPPALLGEEGGDFCREHRVLSPAPTGAAPPALSLYNPPRTLPAQMPARHQSRGQSPAGLFLTSTRVPQALCP